MKPNVGTIDRVIRFVIGSAIIGAGIYFESWWGVIGVVLLFTSIVSSCPAYSLLKISSNNKTLESAKR
ncbi:MAG: hypothetical protein ACI9KN_001562 [Gammaproteobacteria bacterium]|jgi:hypothetical protein